VASIAKDLADLLDGEPAASLDVIVLASGSLEALLEAVPPGVEVRHVYRLRKGIAATADVAAVRVLAASDAVAAIEPDRPVSAAGDSPSQETRT
jgi:hypothetical protein